MNQISRASYLLLLTIIYCLLNYKCIISLYVYFDSWIDLYEAVDTIVIDHMEHILKW